MTRLIPLAALAGLALAGCGRHVGGTYVPAGGGMAPYASLQFGPGKTVDMASILGPTMQRTYAMDGRKVVITVAGTSLVFRVDDKGCLDDGTGSKYCKK